MKLKPIASTVVAFLLSASIVAQTPVAPQMVHVQGGTFTMGTNTASGNDQSRHTVTVNSFSIGKYEVTVAEYKLFCRATGREVSEELSTGFDNHPIANVSYDNAVAYCNWLNEQLNSNYRLPTEAEWEYAARGGNKSQGYSYAGSNRIDEVGWSAENSGESTSTYKVKTKLVGEKKPNELGIYDMSGNVWEWCRDWITDYSTASVYNPKGPLSGSQRVCRGGSFRSESSQCQVAFRYAMAPNLSMNNVGFRLLLPERTGSEIITQSFYRPTTKPEMVHVEAGSFTMGSNSGEAQEKPPHTVTLSSYSIGKFEVTVGQYKDFCSATGRNMPEPPLGGWKDNQPMVNVSFEDANAYCNWLSQKFNGNYRLPTEAEWEYAARGGNKGKGYLFAGGDDMDDFAWFSDNAGGQTQSVGRKKPNELLIFDMTGNVWEWCSDWYDGNYYSSSPVSNPKGASSGTYRIVRGGSWNSSALRCRSTNRGVKAPADRAPFVGFRVAFSE